MAEKKVLAGKNVLITGATSGIGRQSAFALAQQGASLYLLCRNRSKAEALVAEIRKQTGNERITPMFADLASLQEIRLVVSKFLSLDIPLHVLLNNAGALYQSRQLSKDGFEMHFAVNHLGPFVLTMLLLERMKKSAPARIVNVASVAYAIVNERFDFDDVQAEKKYRALRQYGLSKLANILFTRQLSQQLVGSGVTVNAFHPGMVATGFGHNNGALLRLLMWSLRPFSRSPSEAAKTAVYLCASADVEGVSGDYFVDCKPRALRECALNDEDARRLWNLSVELGGAGKKLD